MYSEKESEVLLIDILNKYRNVVVDVDEMRKFYNEIEELRRLVVKCGKKKCGKNNCKLLFNREIEVRIMNIMIMWDKIKMGL